MLMLTSSMVSGNVGGGIYNIDGTLTLTDSTVSGNSTNGSGGGIASTSGAVTLTGSTVSGNSAGENGGGILNLGELNLQSSTVSGNSANSSGGSYTEEGATVTDAEDPNVTVVIGGDTVDAGTVGTYLVTYNATDASGNAASQITREVNVVDANPPETTIVSVVNGKGEVIANGDSTLSDAMTFAFGSNEIGSTFQYSFDGAAFVEASTPLNLTNLAVGSHTLEVRAIDAAGNVDLTPASFTWTVLSPLAAIGNLTVEIETLELPTGIDKGLIRELDGAIEKLDDDNPDNDEAAIGKLLSFIDKVEEQRGVRLSDQEADSLIKAANDIIAEISDELGLNVFDSTLLDLL